MNRRDRLGVTAIETALVLPTYLGLFLWTIDLGFLVFRQHAIDHAAAYAARLASVHGQHATITGEWGPTTIDELATATSIPIVDQIDDFLVCCDLNNTRIVVEWPDGDNAIDSEVRVTITTDHTHLLPFQITQRTLGAQRSLLIEH